MLGSALRYAAITALLFSVGIGATLTTAAAQPAPGPAAAVPADTPGVDPAVLGLDVVDKTIAIIPFDALGMDPELVARLEALFRMEIDRLSKHPVPSRREVLSAINASAKLRRCEGDDECLAEIGQALGTNVVVSGNVAALGDSYVVTIKVVDSKTGQLVRRIVSPPLRGEPDSLIEAVRVAAYSLLAPEELVGSIVVLSDLIGAQVAIDGKTVGKTPLPAPIHRQPLGEHTIEVKAKGYRPFKDKVEVSFQKTTRVVVRLVSTDAPEPSPLTQGPVAPRQRPTPWYGSTWFYVGVGVAAGVAGGFIGYTLAKNEPSCQEMTTQCQPMP